MSTTTKILSLDVATTTGWAILKCSSGEVVVDTYGTVKADKNTSLYPSRYLYVSQDLALKVRGLIVSNPDLDRIVIEETNQGRNRYTQKMIEFFHCLILRMLEKEGVIQRVMYVDTKDWRKHLNIKLTQEDKKNNSTLSKAKSEAKRKKQKLDKKKIGITGKITKKHLAVRYINDRFDLNLKINDNDIADAICIGAAFLEGCSVCDGK